MDGEVNLASEARHAVGGLETRTSRSVAWDPAGGRDLDAAVGFEPGDLCRSRRRSLRASPTLLPVAACGGEDGGGSQDIGDTCVRTSETPEGGRSPWTRVASGGGPSVRAAGGGAGRRPRRAPQLDLRAAGPPPGRGRCRAGSSLGRIARRPGCPSPSRTRSSCCALRTTSRRPRSSRSSASTAMYASTSASRAAASIRRAPSSTISSSAERISALASSSVTTLNIGVPSSPARQRRLSSFRFNEEGTSRPRAGGRPTGSGHTSQGGSSVYLP